MRLRKVELISADSPNFLRETGSVFLPADAPRDYEAYPVLAAFFDKVELFDLNTLWSILPERGHLAVPFYHVSPGSPFPFLVMESYAGKCVRQSTVIFSPDHQAMPYLGDLPLPAVPGAGRTREQPYAYESVPPFEGGCAYLELSRWRQERDAPHLQWIREFETPRHEEVFREILEGKIKEYTRSALQEQGQRGEELSRNP